MAMYEADIVHFKLDLIVTFDNETLNGIKGLAN
jgi:hypothetical protein